MSGQLALECLGLSVWAPYLVPIYPGRKEHRQPCPLSAQAGTRHGDIVRTQVLTMLGHEHSLYPLPHGIFVILKGEIVIYFF